jgi:hypothetical protein
VSVAYWRLVTQHFWHSQTHAQTSAEGSENLAHEARAAIGSHRSKLATSPPLLQLLPVLQRPRQSQVVGIFEVASHGQAARQARHRDP